MPCDRLAELRASVSELSKLARLAAGIHQQIYATLRTTIQCVNDLMRADRRRMRRTARLSASWPDDPRAFGEAVRNARSSLGLSQESLADLAGIHVETIGRVEAGKACTHSTRGWITEAFLKLEQKKERDGIPKAAPPTDRSATAQESWPTDPGAFGKAVRRRRERTGLSQGKLAALVGIATITLGRVEAGQLCNAATREWIIEAFYRLARKRTRNGPRD